MDGLRRHDLRRRRYSRSISAVMMKRAFKSAGNAPNPPEGRVPRPASTMQSGSPANSNPLAQAQSPPNIGIASPLPIDFRNQATLNFLQDREFLREYFARYLAGADLWPDREGLILRIHDGREKRIDGAWDDIYRLEMPIPNMRLNLRRTLPGDDGTAAGRASLIGNEDNQQATGVFGQFGFHVNILKTLGFGGNGVAFLCETRGSQHTSDSGQRNKFVLKLDASGMGMEAEKKLMMVRMQGSVTRSPPSPFSRFVLAC